MFKSYPDFTLWISATAVKTFSDYILGLVLSRYIRVPRQFVYGHFVYDTSSTDISSTEISSTTVYQRTGQLYIQLLLQQIFIFINSNFYLHYDSVYQSHFHWLYDNTTDILLASIVAWQSSLFFQLKTLIFINPASS